MTIHEYGEDNKQVIVLVHPSLVMWDYFEYVIPLLQRKYRLIIPALPGYDKDSPGHFTSVERIASELADALVSRGIDELACMYGCSMGGSIVTRFLADNRVKVRSAVIDGGITPYQLPYILTRCIALRDFLMIYIGKAGGLKLLEKMFNTDEYSAEDLKYAADVLQFMSAKTVWRTFDSSNNYRMPDPVVTDCRYIEYWYASAEKNARQWDMDWFRKHISKTVFKEFADTGHGGLAVKEPALFVSEIERVIQSGR